MDGIDEIMARIQVREVNGTTKVEDPGTRYLAEAQRRAWERVGVPLVHAEEVAGDLNGTPAREVVMSKPRILLALSGPPGTGKTIAACEWLRAFCYDSRNYDVGAVTATFRFDRHPPLFVSSARLARWERYDDERMNVLLKSVRLVVDDIGTEYSDAKGNFMAVFDELVSERAGNKRPTIITTNCDGKAFKERYGERIADRIRESGAFVSLAGPSLRGAK